MTPLLCSVSADSQTFQIGGMYTYSYHDGRYADWGDFAMKGARIAIEDINESGSLGADCMEMKDENVVDNDSTPGRIKTWIDLSKLHDHNEFHGVPSQIDQQIIGWSNPVQIYPTFLCTARTSLGIPA